MAVAAALAVVGISMALVGADPVRANANEPSAEDGGFGPRVERPVHACWSNQCRVTWRGQEVSIALAVKMYEPFGGQDPRANSGRKAYFTTAMNLPQRNDGVNLDRCTEFDQENSMREPTPERLQQQLRHCDHSPQGWEQENHSGYGVAKTSLVNHIFRGCATTRARIPSARSNGWLCTRAAYIHIDGNT